MTDPINDPLSPIRLQIMWDRLIAVVEEQALTLIRTGFSTSTREAGDLSAGVFDITGDMLAQAVTGTPGHVNSMARSVRHFLDRFPVEDMADGDVFLTNDPWKGTGHLHDFTFMTPCFRNGTLVALFASTCHVVDIGGRGMTSDGRSIYEEGLYIPLMRFAHAGKIASVGGFAIRLDPEDASGIEVNAVGRIEHVRCCNIRGPSKSIRMNSRVPRGYE